MSLIKSRVYAEDYSQGSIFKIEKTPDGKFSLVGANREYGYKPTFKNKEDIIRWLKAHNANVSNPEVAGLHFHQMYGDAKDSELDISKMRRVEENLQKALSALNDCRLPSTPDDVRKLAKEAASIVSRAISWFDR